MSDVVRPASVRPAFWALGHNSRCSLMKPLIRPLDDKMLVSSFGCSYETADIEFAFTLSQALDKGNNLGHDRFFYRCKSFLSSNYKLTKGKADWLIGINATRLFSCLYRHTFECGSCTETNLKNAGR